MVPQFPLPRWIPSLTFHHPGSLLRTSSSPRQSSLQSHYYTLPHLAKPCPLAHGYGFLLAKLVSLVKTKFPEPPCHATHAPPALSSIMVMWPVLNENLFTVLFQIVLKYEPVPVPSGHSFWIPCDMYKCKVHFSPTLNKTHKMDSHWDGCGQWVFQQVPKTVSLWWFHSHSLQKETHHPLPPSPLIPCSLRRETLCY